MKSLSASLAVVQRHKMYACTLHCCICKRTGACDEIMSSIRVCMTLAMRADIAKVALQSVLRTLQIALMPKHASEMYQTE